MVIRAPEPFREAHELPDQTLNCREGEQRCLRMRSRDGARQLQLTSREMWLPGRFAIARPTIARGISASTTGPSCIWATT